MRCGALCAVVGQAAVWPMSAFHPEADIKRTFLEVRFVPEADSCSVAKDRYSITSSASDKNDSGIVRPSALAVFRLTTTSNFVGYCTGRSVGLAPLSNLLTYSAPCWN